MSSCGLVRRRRRPARAVRPRARGLGPQRADQRRGLLGRDGRRSGERRADLHVHLDRPARAARRRRARARHVRGVRRHPRDAEQPDRGDGAARLPRLELDARAADVPIVNLPGCPVQPDNITETLLLLALHLAGHGSRARARRAGPSAADLRPDRPRALRPRRASPSRASSRGRPRTIGRCLVKLGCKGPGGQVQRARSAAGSTVSAAARTSAASAWRARCPASPTSSCRSWTPNPLGTLHARAVRFTYGPFVRRLRQSAIRLHYDREPSWRAPGDALRTGYQPRW